jgi:hypothetical protein
MENDSRYVLLNWGKKVTREICDKITGGCLACCKYENNKGMLAGV